MNGSSMTPPESQGGVFIPTEKIYELLRDSIDQTNERLTEIRGDIRAMNEQSHETKSEVRDHEDRIRSIEKWKNRMPATAIAAVLSSAVSAYAAYSKATGK